ncbi:MAG: hypothetical protein M3M94_07050, partial [Actinomycetota bacterium]|nr:hypothetical protein [Actinomycetota bacterium]
MTERVLSAPAALTRGAFVRRTTMTALGFVVATFVVSRAFFFVVGGLATRFLDEARPATNVLEPPGIFHYWAHWDGGWYSAIATRGYEGSDPASSTAFFPLYPLLVRAGTWFPGGPAVWG